MDHIHLSQAPACPGGTLYTIRPGDTLFTLAGRFGTTVAAITAANPNITPNNLQIGQVICIPGPVGPGFCPGGTIYTVQPGDTFFRIAQQFNTSLQALLAANPGVDPNQLQIRQLICVPVPPAPAAVCTIRLRVTDQLPVSQLFPAGVVLIKPAATASEAFTVTFTAAGLPDPSALGSFDAYVGRVTLFPEGGGYSIFLGRVAIGDQPATWAGSRDVLRAPSNRDLLEVKPSNTALGTTGPAVLVGLNLFCEPA